MNSFLLLKNNVSEEYNMGDPASVREAPLNAPRVTL